MNRARGMSTLALVAVLGGCCKEKTTREPVPPPVHPGPVLQPATVSFPWPAEAKGPLDPACKIPEERIKAGLALGVDIWTTVTCEVSRFPEDAPDDAVDKFLAEVRKFVDAIPAPYHRFPTVQLPKYVAVQYGAEDKPDAVLVYATKEALDKYPELRNFKHLESGLVRGICLPWEKTAGHYGVTKSVIAGRLTNANLVLSLAAAEIVADASQDPDFYDWTTMAAHAQTRTDKDALPIASPTDEQSNWAAFVDGYVVKAATACTAAIAAGPTTENGKEQVRRALYYTGYAAHPIEDLASHRGRTNPEHSYNAHVGQNPDVSPVAIELATDMTGTFLEKVLHGRLSHCMPLFHSYDGRQVMHGEKRRIIGRSFEMYPWAIAAYNLSWGPFEKRVTDTLVHVRWFGGDAPQAKCADDPACQQLLLRVAH